MVAMGIAMVTGQLSALSYWLLEGCLLALELLSDAHAKKMAGNSQR
jgi:hypothetical protein